MEKLTMLMLCIVITIVSIANCNYTRVSQHDLMKCSYGERGSLTATCVNAISSYFKNTIYKFDHLDETLRCINCTLYTIEPNAFDISGNQIKNLDLRNSLIDNLSIKSFMGLIFLENLDLSNNHIKAVLAGTFNGAKKIIIINLSRNNLSELVDNGFAELNNLEQLNLSHNSIRLLNKKSFNGLVKLQQLDLSFNLVEEIFNTLFNSTSLEILKLNDNRLKYLKGTEFYDLTNLKLLDLSRNYLVTPEITIMPGNKLRKILLTSNDIDTFWIQLGQLYDLEELDVSNNSIQDVHSMPLESLHNLRVLDLSNNNLTIIRTGQFTGLPQLKFLNCSHNQISEIRITGVLSLPSLHSLDLSHNSISDLDYSMLLSRTPALSYLRLEDNYLPCDLEAQMEKDFIEDSFKFVLYENVLGSRKCVDVPVIAKSIKYYNDVVADGNSGSVNASEIFVFIMLSFAFIAIGVLFYVQYLLYKGRTLTSSRLGGSNVQLITAEIDGREITARIEDDTFRS